MKGDLGTLKIRKFPVEQVWLSDYGLADFGGESMVWERRFEVLKFAADTLEIRLEVSG